MHKRIQNFLMQYFNEHMVWDITAQWNESKVILIY